ncbi:hypothetical protein CWI88_07580 [Enterobacter cancerogenus]|nr:hypothetical protein CWI88_07580 [Enterobacter cancerogenus]
MLVTVFVIIANELKVYIIVFIRTRAWGLHKSEKDNWGELSSKVTFKTLIKITLSTNCNSESEYKISM